MPSRAVSQLSRRIDQIIAFGVIIDGEPSMDAQARNVVCSCFYQLRQLRSVRRSLATDDHSTLAAAFIASRVGYCNAVLYGASAAVIRRLQMVLNAAARLVVNAGKYEHIMPVLRDVLHWLPVRQRIAVTALYCVHGTGPAYFQQVCLPVAKANVTGRLHLHVERRDLLVPWTRTQFDRQSFHVAAPVIWNSLPARSRSASISRG